MNRNDNIKIPLTGIPLKVIKEIFENHCVNIKSYNNYSVEWEYCDNCCLSFIEWNTTPNITRDLCFAIWHEGILDEQKKKHLHKLDDELTRFDMMDLS